MLVAATAALIAFIPSLRRFSHGARGDERQTGLIQVRERHFLGRRVGHWRLPHRSAHDQLYDASEVERLVREQLYGRPGQS